MMNSSEKTLATTPLVKQSHYTHRLLNIVSWGLFVIVLVFVYWRGRSLLGAERINWTAIQPRWVIISIIVYCLSIAPQAWYFRRLIQAAKYSPAILPTFQAHITGHLGKYVPGKTMVVLIRSALMKRQGIPFLTTVWAAMLETLVFMAVGGLWGAISFPYLLHSIEFTRWQNWLGPQLSTQISVMLPFRFYLALSLLLLTLILVPILTPILDKLAGKLSQKKTSSLLEEGRVEAHDSRKNDKHIRQIDVWRGIGWQSLSWMLQCLSLVTVMFAWGINTQSPIDYFVWGSVVVVSTVVGFLAFFSPGGLGVKDALLVELLLLTSPISKSQAVAVAITHRLITLAGEVFFTLFLWFLNRHNSRK